MRERESLFDEFLLEVRRREKEEKAAKREQVSSLSCHYEGDLGRGMHTHIEVLISVTHDYYLIGIKGCLDVLHYESFWNEESVVIFIYCKL